MEQTSGDVVTEVIIPSWTKITISAIKGETGDDRDSRQAIDILSKYLGTYFSTKCFTYESIGAKVPAQWLYTQTFCHCV